ncbi:prephenate dehydrogenase/arogenate dehydrogenase family protein [Candidatus Poribacteria bacterium]|nr:prephenate dehydrogenase/arogenate dehydrogenase family protein [Candidatus Poribacteria bacterium]
MGIFKSIDNFVIIGVGLIGGSVGLGLKKAGYAGKITGLGRRWSSLNNAIEMGAVDSATLDFNEALRNADMVLVSTPVDIIPSMVIKAAEYTPDECIITDAGSTKAFIVSEVKSSILNAGRFIGAHPMAGSHKSGVTASCTDLFHNSRCIITPTDSTPPPNMDTVIEMWKMLGAQTEIMSPEEHDFLIAAASHLPHVTACALTRVVSAIENSKGKAIDFAATGFADTTRIAAGSPEIWAGILQQNSVMVSQMLEKIEKELASIRKNLDSGDLDAIYEILQNARKIRNNIKTKNVKYDKDA